MLAAHITFYFHSRYRYRELLFSNYLCYEFGQPVSIVSGYFFPFTLKDKNNLARQK